MWIEVFSAWKIHGIFIVFFELFRKGLHFKLNCIRDHNSSLGLFKRARHYEESFTIFFICSSYRIQEGDDSESEESSDEEDIFGISYLPGQNDSWNSGEDESESDSDSEIVFEVKANDDDDDDSGGIVFAEKSMVEGKTGVVENV